MFAKGYTMRELLYDFGPGARFRPDNVPPIICTTRSVEGQSVTTCQPQLADDSGADHPKKSQ